MVSPSMGLGLTGQVARLSKDLRTQSTGKWFISSMSSCVTGQVARRSKRLSTQSAGK